MAQTTIKITGMKEVTNALRNLPIELKKEISNGGMEFMKAVRKSAQLRAPKFTGKLAESINIQKEKENKIILSVDSPYGSYQEFGFSPHPVHRNMSTRVGGKIGDWMNSKGIRGDFITVSKNKPFIQPALEHNIAKLQTIISDRSNKAIKRSFK